MLKIARMSWMFLVLLYGLLKGGREIAKKKAMETNSVMDVLVAYTVLSLIMVLPQAPQAGGLEPRFYFFIALKSFCMFCAWLCGFYCLKKLPVSLYGIISLSRVIFGTLLGVIFLHETMTVLQIAGLILVIGGLLMLKFKPHSSANPVANPANSTSATVSVFLVLLAFASCIFNSFSGFMDKILMRDISSAQLQFWYMLFIVIYYILFVLIKRQKLSWTVLKNGWVWALAAMFVIGDKALFIANANPNSRITMMTLIKQSACIVTILGGKFIFHEKGIGYKLICAAVVICGIVLGVM